MAVTIKEIKDRVERHEKATRHRRKLMDEDFLRWRLEWKDSRDEAQADNYQTYVTNEPKTYLNKLINTITASTMTVRNPQSDKPRAEREVDNTKELFIIGAFRSGDDWLKKRGLPTLVKQLAGFSGLRGFCCGRAMFVKDKDGRVRFESMPWDPLHTFWEMGPFGLKWICYRTKKTREEIKAQYGVTLDGPASTGTEPELFVTWDYYDDTVNALAADTEAAGRWLKRPTPHKLPRTPGYVRPVGWMPPIQSNGVGDTDKDFGQSAYDAVRDVYEDFNETMSDMKTLVRRAVKSGYKLKSAGARKGLEGDPAAEGSVVQLDSASNEDLSPMERVEMPKEAGTFLSNVSGEMQRGTLPHSVFGELQFQLSGFAINTLREGVGSAVEPFLTAIEDSLCEIASLANEQYQTGQFGPITLRGQTYSKEWFEREFKPSDIKGTDCPIIELRPNLPEDEPEKFAMAQIARTADAQGFPMLPDSEIWDTILKFQDPDAVKVKLQEQMGERANPIAANLSIMLAMMKMGREDLVVLYGAEMMKLLQERYGQQPQSPAIPGLNAAGGAAALPAGPEVGFDPAVLPDAALGGGPPAPFPQGGALVPAGAVRPGAAADEAALAARLAASGLILGR